MREILIFLGGAMFDGFVAFLTFCMLAGIRMKREESYALIAKQENIHTSLIAVRRSVRICAATTAENV